jgi:hypothetical protein
MRYASYHDEFPPSFGADKAFDWIVEAINPADLAAPGGQKTDYRLLKCIFKAVRADPSFEPTPGAAEVQDTIVYLCSSVDTAILPLSTFQDLVDRFVIAYYRDKPLEHLIDRIYLYDMDGGFCRPHAREHRPAFLSHLQLAQETGLLHSVWVGPIP